MRSVICLALLVGWVGCTSPNPKSCLDHHCSDPALPFCDEDGSIGGTPGTCIAVGCTANTFEECRGDLALTCNATGDDYLMVDCPYGCGATGCLPCNTAACEKHIIPKYLPAVCDELTTLAAVTITQDKMLDTSVASNCSTVVTQMNGPEICVVRGPTITIEAQKTFKVVGSRVLALVADRDLVVAGILDASADYSTNGPGGGFLPSGSGAGQAGGGAGFRTVGASGGNDAGDGGAANGGLTAPNPSLVTALMSGPRATRVAPGQPSGGGGGGTTLISCRGMISVAGTVDVGGGGGIGDAQMLQAPFTYSPSSGGGAGGVAVLQAVAVNVSGGVFANGGGGGGGGGPGNSGSDGLRSRNPAPGGPPGGLNNTGGMGGVGGAIVGPGPGTRPATTNCGTGCGAGGASAGFVLTYSPVGSSPGLDTATVSPAFEPHITIPTN